jgi:hypothetical protein
LSLGDTADEYENRNEDLAHRLTVDRFEGDDKSIAVLLSDNGTTSITQALLPKGGRGRRHPERHDSRLA